MSDVDASLSMSQSIPRASTRAEVIKLVKSYMAEHGGAAGGAVAVEALASEFEKIDPTLAFQFFCDLILKVNKAVIGSDEDPSWPILAAAVNKAPQQLWEAAKETTARGHLENLLKRLRTLLSVLARHERRRETLDVLKLLTCLPLTPEEFGESGIPSAVSRVAGQTNDEDVHKLAEQLREKYPSCYPDEPAVSPKVASLKLLGQNGTLKLRSHKRPRSEDGKEEENGDHKPVEENSVEAESPARKKRAGRKHVSWKPDAELVQVRFFEVEGLQISRSSKIAKLQELEEGSDLHMEKQWHVPEVINFDKIFKDNEDMYQLMSTKRGGSKEPSSGEAQIQEVRESQIPGGFFMARSADTSPGEPPANESAPDPNIRPRQGGHFIAVEPRPEFAADLKKEEAAPVAALPPQPMGMPIPMMPMPMAGFPWFPMMPPK